MKTIFKGVIIVGGIILGVVIGLNFYFAVVEETKQMMEEDRLERQFESKLSAFEIDMREIEPKYLNEMENCVDSQLDVEYSDYCFKKTVEGLEVDFVDLAYKHDLDPMDFQVSKYHTKLIDKIFQINNPAYAPEANIMTLEYQRLAEVICITSTKLTTETDCIPTIEKKIEQFSRWEGMNLNQMKTEYQNCIDGDGRGLFDYECQMEANDMAVVHCGFMTSEDLVKLLESGRVKPKSEAHTQALADRMVKEMFEQKTPCKQEALNVIFDSSIIIKTPS